MAASAKTVSAEEVASASHPVDRLRLGPVSVSEEASGRERRTCDGSRRGHQRALVLRQQLRLTDELRGAFEHEGVVFESAFSVDAERPVAVFVCQVNLPGTRPLAESRRVVKFSKKQHAVPRAECLKLATPQRYRHNFEDAEGIHDELEAKHHEDLRRYLTRFAVAPLLRPDPRHVSGQATYALDHFWMFCTSVKPWSEMNSSR